MIVAVLIALPAGIRIRPQAQPLADSVGTVFAISGLAVPNFWLGILLIYAFALWLGWLPPSGFTPLAADPGENIKHMVLPAFALGAAQAAVVMRQVRAALIEVLQQEYVLAARAKGLRERVVVMRHALKNAAYPGGHRDRLQTGRLFGGSVIIETIFAMPGLGRLAADSIFFRDFP